MFTRDDQTVEDCLEVFEAIRDVGLTHLGFKDVGVDARVLGRLTERIKRAGGTTHLEVVSTTAEACLRSARAAVEIACAVLRKRDVARVVQQAPRHRAVERLVRIGK